MIVHCRHSNSRRSRAFMSKFVSDNTLRRIWTSQKGVLETFTSNAERSRFSLEYPALGLPKLQAVGLPMLHWHRFGNLYKETAKTQLLKQTECEMTKRTKPLFKSHKKQVSQQ